MSDKPAILIADDDQNIVYAFKKTFAKKYKVRSAGNGQKALQVMESGGIDLAFLDVSMPGMDGLAALEQLRARGDETPVVVITGFGTMNTAIRAVQLGAYEYLTKPLDVEQVRIVAQRALEMSHLREEVRSLKSQLERPDDEHELIGGSASMQEVYKLIGAVSTTPNTTNVLITGESGSGKELVARAIHSNSENAEAPFMAINCTVMPENLLESEFYGYERGAFTGAVTQKLGKFEVAGNGTIFLDEIGDMPPNLQQKLLRVLQERVFERLGGHDLLPVNARFIAASNRNLKMDVAKGQFREDLFFRLNVIAIDMPPLRTRREDIPVLAEHFVRRYAARLQRPIRGIAQDAMDFLLRHDFPGNVRELRNMIERAVILEKGDVLTTNTLGGEEQASPGATGLPDTSLASLSFKEAKRRAIEGFERAYLLAILRDTGGNVSDAARKSGLARQSLQRLMRQYEVRSEEFRRG